MKIKTFASAIVAISVLFAISCKKDNTLNIQDPDVQEISGINMLDLNTLDVRPSNTAQENKVNLQAAIDEASITGASLYLPPSDSAYAIASGVLLRDNVSLIGASAAAPRGTKHPSKNEPVGSVVRIEDADHPFITVQSATKIANIQFWYPDQAFEDTTAIIAYPPTIQTDQQAKTEGVTLSELTFYGEYTSMDFNASAAIPCELIYIENCYGYPLSGEFIRINYCYDIPRILHCHMNPAVMRSFKGQYPVSMIDAVVRKHTYAYTIDHTDNAQVIDVFAFGNYGGALLGDNSYGQMTNFNFDCVTLGVHKKGANSFNRDWMVSQGSIIANTGPQVQDIHPFLVEGEGQLSIVNVEAFSGKNAALTTIGQSYDFMRISSSQNASVVLTGVRMRNYIQNDPITFSSDNITFQAIGCIDKNENTYNYSQSPAVSNTVQVMDACDVLTGWTSGNSLALDASDFKEGTGSIRAEGANTVIFTKKYTSGFDTKVSKEKGYLSFWIYVSDVSKLDIGTGKGAVEITSSGISDTNEYAWPLENVYLVSGWNKVILKLSAAITTNGAADLAALNYFRVYQTLKGSAVFKIDGIKFSDNYQLL